MVRVCVRRSSDSQYSRAIYEAIKGICYQKQCPNEERILRFVLREFEWKQADISKQLRFAVEDGLFRETLAISHKGCKKGNEQLSYRIINSLQEPNDLNGNSKTTKDGLDEHDWYCFDCQESGEVILCEFCPRVFHRKCAKAHYISQDESWKCPSCKAAEEINSMSSLPKEKIAKMLEFTMKRLKEKMFKGNRHHRLIARQRVSPAIVTQYIRIHPVHYSSAITLRVDFSGCLKEWPCQPRPCHNGGTCFDFNADYRCSCANGWAGRNCDVKIANCRSEH